MSKPSHTDELKKLKGWHSYGQKCLCLVYGDPLYKSDAVKYLEFREPSLPLWYFTIGKATMLGHVDLPSFLTSLLANCGDTDSDFDKLDKDALELFEKQSPNFFRDYAEAKERRLSTRKVLHNHYLIMQFYNEHKDKIVSGKRDIPTQEELGTIAPHGDISTIACDLGLVELGLLRKVKRGRKSGNRT